MKSLDTQINQISQAISPKDCKVINLKSGRSYESPSMPREKEKSNPDENDEGEEKDEEEEKDEKEDEEKEEEILRPEANTSTPQIPIEVKVPFPYRLKKKKLEDQFSKFLDIYMKVQINIPLVEALQQMPSYAKFLKGVISKKRRWMEHETVNLTESCSAIIQKKLRANLKDPGSFTISSIVGDSQVGKALCDLGASINFIPFSFF